MSFQGAREMAGLPGYADTQIRNLGECITDMIRGLSAESCNACVESPTDRQELFSSLHNTEAGGIPARWRLSAFVLAPYA